MPFPITIRTPKIRKGFYSGLNPLHEGSFDYDMLDTSNSRWPSDPNDIDAWLVQLELGATLLPVIPDSATITYDNTILTDSIASITASGLPADATGISWETRSDSFSTWDNISGSSGATLQRPSSGWGDAGTEYRIKWSGGVADSVAFSTADISIIVQELDFLLQLSNFELVTINNVAFNSSVANNLRITIVTSTAVTLFDGDYPTNNRLVLDDVNAVAYYFFDQSDGGYIDAIYSLNRTNITGGFGSLAFSGATEVAVNNPTAITPFGIASLAVGSDTELNIIRPPEVRVGGAPRRNVVMATLPQTAGVASWRLVDGANTYQIAISQTNSIFSLVLTLATGQQSGLRFEIIHPTTGLVYEGVITGATTSVNITEAQYDAIFGPSTDLNNLDSRVLTIYNPDSRETPSLAIAGDSAIDITTTTAVRLAGIGTLAFSGSSLLQISSILQQLPVSIILPRTGNNTWTSDPANTEQRLFAGTAANRAITINRSGTTLTISITGNVDFDDDVEEADVLFSIYIGGRVYVLFRDVTGASHVADHPYEYTITTAERNLLRDANTNQSLLTMVFSRPDPVYVPQSIGEGEFSGDTELTVTSPTPVRLGGIGEVALSGDSEIIRLYVRRIRIPSAMTILRTDDIPFNGTVFNTWAWIFPGDVDDFEFARIVVDQLHIFDNVYTLSKYELPSDRSYLNLGFTITHPTLGVVYDQLAVVYETGRGTQQLVQVVRETTDAIITPVSENPTVYGNRVLTLYEVAYPTLEVSGDTALSIIPPATVNPAGIGTLAYSGVSSVVVADPNAISVAGIGTLAFNGNTELNVVNPTQVRSAGIGTLALSGDAAVIVEASEIPIPTGITEGSTGEITFGDYRLQWSDGFNETYSFRTGIVEHRGGTEQRIAHRSKPRVNYEFTAFLNSVEMRSFIARNSTDQGHLTYIPHPRDTIKSPQEIPTSGNLISFDPIPGWMIPGSRIFAKFNQYIIPGVVLGIGGSGALLAFSNTTPMPIGTKIFRGAPIRPTSSQTINAITSRAGTMPVRAAGDPVDNWLPDYPATAPNALDSKEYFDLKPNWSNPVGIGMVEDWEDIDFQRGAVSRVFPKLFPQRLMRYNYLLHTQDRIEHILGLFFRVRGRQKSFWMPSFVNEAKIAENTTRRRMIIPGNQFALTYDESPVFKYLRIEHQAGVYTAEIRRVEEDADGNSEVVFEERLPASLTPDEINMISWVNLVRFETDSITLNWRTDGVAETTINVRTLEVEIPT